MPEDPNFKRILVLNYEWPPLGGGASPVSYELAKRLSETGEYDIDVVTMRYKGLPAYEELNDHLRVHRVWSLRSKKEMCYPWEQLTYLVTGYFKTRALIKKGKYEVCHTHFIIPTGVLAWVLKKQFGLEYVITSHGSDVLGYNKRFAKLYPLLVRPWKAVLDSARTIISPSHFLKGEILKVYPEYDEKKIVVIPNGIDTEKFKPQPKKNYIFSSGRLMVNKGFQYLIQAVSDEDLDWEVHIAGDGPMRGKLEELAKKSKTKIVFHGWINNKSDLYHRLMTEASIFVLASKFENSSIVLLEALSSGCAIIANDVGGNPEILKESGILCAGKDIDLLSKSILKVTSNVEIREKMQEKGRRTALERYDWKKICGRYSDSI